MIAATSRITYVDTLPELSLDAARELLPPRTLQQQLCTQCGQCVQACPAGAITCTPYPEFGSSCILCYTCMRICPEKAIQAELSGLESWLNEKAQTNAEQPLSEIFI